MTRTPILDLSTLVDDRPPIRIDGATYHLKSPEELSLLESQQFTSWGKDLEELGKDSAAAEALKSLVGIVAWQALADVPGDVFDRLSGTQRMNIVEVFTGLLLDRRLRLAGAISARAIQSIGESSSRASNTPSAETPATGFPASLQHS